MAKTKSNGIKEAAAAYSGASAVLSILMATGLGPAIAFVIPTAAGAFAVAAYLMRFRDCGAAFPTAVGTSIVMAAYAAAIIASPGEGALYAAAAVLAAFAHLAVLAGVGCPDDVLYV